MLHGLVVLVDGHSDVGDEYDVGGDGGSDGSVCGIAAVNAIEGDEVDCYWEQHQG